MKNLNVEKKTRSLYFFILITTVPIFGVVVMFSYAFLYIQNNINIISNEINGLRVITKIERTVFNIQRLRGLSCITNPNKKSIANLEYLKNSVSNNLVSLKHTLLMNKEESPLEDELLKYIDAIDKSFFVNRSYENLTKIIEEFMMFSNRMAYNCKLVLDSDFSSHILIQNVVYLLPELIEYNGHIRAIASSINEDVLTSEQKEKIVIQKAKIKERLAKLNYNKLFMYEKVDKELLEHSYKNIIEKENSIIEFIDKYLLQNSRVTYEPNKLFTLITSDIDSLVNLYNLNLNNLNSILKKHLRKNKLISTLIILFGLVAILFIVYINNLFYNKNREFIDKIEELTVTDSMTTLYNRRYFDQVFESSLKIQQRTKETLVFIILDIDFFKQYNDTYGHQAGDLAIEVVAKNLKHSLRRAGDMAFRLGGEEFGILCIGMNESDVFSFADEIRKNIENEKLEHQKNYVSKYLTVSMGIVMIQPDEVSSTTDIYRCADEALYEAKESGRNRVVMRDIKKSC